MNQLKVKILTYTAHVPERAHPSDAGLDLYSDEPDFILNPGQRMLVSTGVAIEVDPGYVGLIYPRSGNAIHKGISLVNCVGVIDASFRGALCVPLINHGEEDVAILRNDKIAQLVITPISLPSITLVSSLSETDRGSGGFGSTGR